LLKSNHGDGSIASEFFTGDDETSMTDRTNPLR
jgi:hypothetical protein